MRRAPIILLGLALSGLALGIHDVPVEDIGPPVLTEDQIRARIIEDVSLLGTAEYYCHWNRFRTGVMMAFTDMAIETSKVAETMRESAPGDEIVDVLREFTEAKWDDLGSRIGQMTLTNGIDDSVNWVQFARSAGGQMIQRILADENNWPYMGTFFADQAVAMAQAGQDQVWSRFGVRAGEAIGRGTEAEWLQWGRQVGLQARALTDEPTVDWTLFGTRVADQAMWFAAGLDKTPPDQD
ncbi:MAG: hypothetical protein MK116_09535 [Phycisphaerales bacterium]|nr:hypothetical protein [Phycisphaerales bacterium]